MKKILIIGKNGQLGTELEKQAKKQSLKVFAFGREDFDITNFIQVEKIISEIKPSIVINASAYHVVPDCESYPDKAFTINTIALKKISEVCNNNNALLVTVSTDYIFDGRKGIPYKEIDTPNPLQIYGISKVAGEYIVTNYCNKFYIIRTCGVYGGKIGSRSKKGNFILTILKQVEGKETLEVSSEQIVSPTYAFDLADAILKLIQKDVKFGTYHLVNEGYCSWAEFATEIVRLKGIKTKIIPVDRSGMSGSLRRPLFSALKNSKAKELKVILPTWKNALKRYLATLD